MPPAAHRALRLTMWTAIGLYAASAALVAAGQAYGAVVDRLR